MASAPKYHTLSEVAIFPPPFSPPSLRPCTRACYTSEELLEFPGRRRTAVPLWCPRPLLFPLRLSSNFSPASLFYLSLSFEGAFSFAMIIPRLPPLWLIVLTADTYCAKGIENLAIKYVQKAADAACIGKMHSSLRQTQVEIFLLFSISIFSRLWISEKVLYHLYRN